jgi:hypothetical protein
MKKLTICLIALLGLLPLINAQPNLVPNPQFELNRASTRDFVYQSPQMEKYQKGCLEKNKHQPACVLLQGVAGRCKLRP